MKFLMERLLTRLRLGDRFGSLLNRLLYLLTVGGVLFENEIEVVDLLLRNVNVEPAQFIAQLLVALGLADLTLQGTDLALHFAQNVGLAEKILLGLIDFS